MAKPEAVRRVKSYSAANGYVYQYYFYELNRVSVDGEAAVGIYFMQFPRIAELVLGCGFL